MTEIKPCPFCGSEGDLLRMCGSGCSAFWVSCDICECEGPTAQASETEVGAIEGWNTRTPDPSLIAGLREAREALAESREALHFHYVEWDGEPEDAVPLQLARSQCDAAIARLDTLLSQEGQP